MQPRHTGFPTSRHVSVQPFGSVAAISHIASTGINLKDARAPHRISGMPPLHDHSRAWRKSPAAVTDCWPLQRDQFGSAVHPETDAYATKTGHFFYHARANEIDDRWQTRTQTAPLYRTSSFPAPPAERSMRHYDWPETEHQWGLGPPHVALGLRPPKPSTSNQDPSLRMATHFSTGAGFAGSAPGANLLPRYLNLPVPKGRFQTLPPPWGEAVPQHQIDGIISRYPTMAG